MEFSYIFLIIASAKFVFANSAANLKTRIVNGQAFERGAYPWIVALLYQEEGMTPKYFCGATVLSSSFIISGKGKKIYFNINQQKIVLSRSLFPRKKLRNESRS